MLKILEEQLTESKKPLPKDTNEMYSHPPPPTEVFALYKKEKKVVIRSRVKLGSVIFQK